MADLKKLKPKGKRSDSKDNSFRIDKNVLTAVGRGIVIFILICIIAGCIVASVLTVYILNSVNNEEVISLEDAKLSLTSIMYAPDEAGDYFELARIQNVENRIWVDYGEIPQHVLNAAIAIEDKRFNTHHGVDWQRTANAVLLYFTSDDLQGGSTITQQLIKNITGDDDVRPDRKVREIFRAINLEKYYSKEQIIESYLNTINLGNGVYGVEAAANLYFGKSISEVSIAEGAALIAITKNPTAYNPLRYPENNAKRQGDILFFMHEQNLITDEEYDEAAAEELVFKGDEYIKHQSTTRSWFVDYVYNEVIDDLVSTYGYEKNYASGLILSGGYRIYTTVDAEMQDYLEEAFISPNTFPALVGTTYPDDNYPQSTFVIMGLNGELKAIVGSNREKDGALLFNRASDAMRQPGSAIKPVATYALAIETGLVNFSTIVDDNPIILNEGTPSARQYPRNHYGSYMGDITVATAIQRSTNTIPVKLMRLLTPRVSFDFLSTKLGFDTLVENRVLYGQVLSDADLAPMALGALTDGVRPLQLVASYQIFGNGGYYSPPYSYTHVYDNEGTLVLEKRPQSNRVISAETATIMNRLLQSTTTSTMGTGTGSRFSAMPIAGKTGTSENDHDQWFIGVTPYYVAGCWLGHDTPSRIGYYTYAPPVIYSRIMGPIHADLEIKQFEVWGNVETKNYCAESGLIASPDCPIGGVGWYKTTAMPATCTQHSGGIFSDGFENGGGFTEGEGEGDEDGRETGTTAPLAPVLPSSSTAPGFLEGEQFNN